MKKPLSAAALTILNALLWAAAMLGASTTLADESGTIQNLLLAGWFVTHMLVVGAGIDRRSAAAEWRCLRARFGRAPGHDA